MLADITATITMFLEVYGLLAIFLIMLLKEIGVPIPIPKDLLMLVAAAQSAAGKFILWQGFLALLVASVLGAWVQYLLVRRLGRPFLYRFGRYLGLTPPRLDRAAEAVRKGGIPTISASLVTPGLRIATVPACALAELSYRVFLPGLVLGSAAFLALHFALGYIGGSLVNALLQAAGLPVLAFVALFLLVGLVGWLLIRRRRRGAPHRHAATTLETLGDWGDACCPACLALGAMNQLREARQPG